MPELGKATYRVVLDTTEYNAGWSQAKARAAEGSASIARSTAVAEGAMAEMGPVAQGAAAETSAAFSKMEAAAASAAARTNAATTAMALSWNKANALARSMTRKITVPALAVTGFAIKGALDYGEQITLLRTQAGATADEMRRADNAIKAFAASGKSTAGPQALAKAMFHIESSGFRGAQAMDILKESTYGAMVGNSDMEATTNALVAAMKTGIRGAETMDGAMGILNATIGAGNMRMDDLVSTFTTGVYPAASAVGLSLKDVGAAVAVFTQRGVPAQVAATRLRMTFAQMAAPNDKAREALKKMGLSGRDLADMMRGPGGLPAAIDLLNQRTQAIQDPVKRTQLLLNAFGGGRTGSAMLTLVQNSDKLAEAYATVEKNAGDFGAAKIEAAREPINRLRAAWARMQESMIRLGEAAAPILADIGQWLGRLFQSWNRLGGGTKKTILIMLGIATVAGPIIRITSLVVKLGKAIRIMALIAAGAQGFGGVGTAAGAATVKAGGLRTMLLGLGRMSIIIPITLMVIGLEKLKADIEGLQKGVIAAEGRAAGAGVTSTLVPKIAQQIREMKFRGMSGKEILAALKKQYGTSLAAADIISQAMQESVSKGWGGVTGGPGHWVYPPPGATGGPVYVGAPPMGPGGAYVPPEAGAGGGGAVPGLDSKAWRRLQLELVRAQRSETTADDLRILGEQEAMLRTMLAQHGLSLKKRMAIETELTSVDGQIRSINEQLAKDSVVVEGPIIPQAMTVSYLEAQLTKSLKDDLAALKTQEHYLRGLLKNRNLALDKRIEILQQLISVTNELNSVRDQIKDKLKEGKESGAEAMAALALRGTIFAQFASSIFNRLPGGGLSMGATPAQGSTSTRTMNYWQTNNFREIPKDRYKTARQMKMAAEGAMG